MNDILSALPEAWRNNALSFMAGGLLISVGLGWSGFYRSDPFTGKEGDALADRVTKLEDRQPVTYPPPDWQIWRQSVTSQMDALRTDDRHSKELIAELRSNCSEHNKESEPWKRRIERNEQSIENLWLWFQESMQ